MANVHLQAFDQLIRNQLSPLLTEHGFLPSGNRRYLRMHKATAIKEIIEIQLGRGILQGCFCINLRFIQETPGKEGENAKREKCFRLGAWPHSLTRIPQIIAFSPVLSIIFPLLWVSLFTDSWWRIPKNKIWLRLVVSDVTNLVSTKGLHWFAGQYATT